MKAVGSLIKELREKKGYSQRQLALYSKVSNTEISKIESGDRQNPNPEILKKIAASLNVDYKELFKAAGYLESDNKEQRNDNPSLTRRDEREIEKILEETRKELENAEGLMFSGEPATPEAIQSIIDSMHVGMKIAKQRHKEKYTPKKYRKDKDEG